MLNKFQFIVFILFLACLETALAKTDPTAPKKNNSNSDSIKTTEQKQPYIVSAIFFSKKNPQAIINKKLVSVGDPIGNGVVSAISQYYLVINETINGSKIEYKLSINNSNSNQFKVRNAGTH